MILLKFNNRVATGFRTFPNPHAPRIHIKKRGKKKFEKRGGNFEGTVLDSLAFITSSFRRND